MQKIEVYVLNAFAKTRDGGNPAGIVLDAEFLPESLRRKMAARIGFSETAFIEKSDVADFKITFLLLRRKTKRKSTAYLFRHGKIAHGQTQRLVFEQGHYMRRPSEILVRLVTEKKEIRRVQVGGKATAAKEIK